MSVLWRAEVTYMCMSRNLLMAPPCSACSISSWDSSFTNHSKLFWSRLIQKKSTCHHTNHRSSSSIISFHSFAFILSNEKTKLFLTAHMQQQSYVRKCLAGSWDGRQSLTHLSEVEHGRRDVVRPLIFTPRADFLDLPVPGTSREFKAPWVDCSAGYLRFAVLQSSSKSYFQVNLST